MGRPMEAKMQVSTAKSDSSAAGILRGIFRKQRTVKDREEIAHVDSKQLKRALKGFIEELRAVQSAIHSGHVPSADNLEKTRLELVKALSTASIGSELAALQKLLKGAIVELIAALRTPGISVAALQSILERHEKELPQSENFWELTI
jgi:hypothetical protein